MFSSIFFALLQGQQQFPMIMFILLRHFSWGTSWKFETFLQSIRNQNLWKFIEREGKAEENEMKRKYRKKSHAFCRINNVFFIKFFHNIPLTLFFTHNYFALRQFWGPYYITRAMLGKHYSHFLALFYRPSCVYLFNKNSWHEQLQQFFGSLANVKIQCYSLSLLHTK